MKKCNNKTGKIVFLDRDGVINEDSVLYIKKPSEFHFIPQSPQAVALLNEHGFEVIIITNQSMIGRKMADIQTLEAIFDKMKSGISEAGGRIKDIFYCPHSPDEGCDCRKPKPGMIQKARDRHRIDLKVAVMVGDSAKDVACGINAGCGATCLVSTGNGAKASKELVQKGMAPDFIAKDLYHAAQWIIARSMGKNE